MNVWGKNSAREKDTVMKRKIVSALVAAAVSVSLGVSGIPAAASGNVPGGAETFAWKAETADSEADENTKSAAQPGELPDTQNTGEVQPTEVPSDSETSQTETSGTGESPELSDTNEPDPDDSGDSDVSQPTVTPGGAAEETETETPVQPEEGNFLPDNSVPEEQPAEVETAPADQAQIPQVMALYRQWQQENGVWYYYNADGERATGWLEDGGNLYYLNPDGSMATGWQQIDGKWYYFRSWGAAYRNEIFTDPSDGNIYYGLSDGSMAKSSWIQIDGKWYYFRSWGAAYRNEIFTDPADGNIYYGLSDGSMAKSSWIQIGGKWYYFRSWGAAYHNEIFTDPANGNIYYGSSDGSVVVNQWVQTSGGRYRFDSQGRAYRNQWFDSAGNPTSYEPAIGFYYVGSNGVMLTDTYYKTQKDGGDYYYSFSGTGACNYADPQYVRAKDSVNGIYYVMEHQYFTDPQVSERDLMAAICAAEAGIQRTTGMTAVAMVVRNRMEEYGYSMKTAIYRQQQFEPARNGSLTRYLRGISSGTSSIMQELVNTGAYIAADTSEKIMNDYKTNGTNRVIPGFGDTRADFDYLYFMTPAAFERLNLDPEKCVTYTYTYQGATYTSSHIFFVNWVRKS